jgi:3'(2'), 5'-bisphosphate nucleotidase
VTDHELAARLATDAGRLLLAVRDEQAGATAGERKAAGDKRSHDFLMEALAAERPDDAVLSDLLICRPELAGAVLAVCG